MASLASRLDGGILRKTSGNSTSGRAERIKQQQRPAPYAKAGPVSPSNVANQNGRVAGANNHATTSDRWEHDLFNPLSDLYNPQLNSGFPAGTTTKTRRIASSGGVFGKAMEDIGVKPPSPSLRPFGSATLPVASTSQRYGSEQYPPGDLFSSIGMNGISSRTGGGVQLNDVEMSAASSTTTDRDERRARQREIAHAEELARERERERKLARQRESKEAEAKRLAQQQEEEAARKALLEQVEQEQYVSRQQEEEAERKRRLRTAGATQIQVKNLVNGTTPEDVQAAFADFGEILSCDIKEVVGDTVTMIVEFAKRNEAKNAVDKLNGALADGRTLELSVIEQPKFTRPAATSLSIKSAGKVPQASAPSLHDRMGLPLKGSQQRQDRPSSTRSVASSHALYTPASHHEEQQDNMDTDEPAAPSRMRSAHIAQFDPRASLQTEPALQRLEQARTRPSRGDHSHLQGRLSGHNDKGRAGQMANGVSNSLLARLGASARR